MADENSIAIVGMSGHFPGARNPEEFWAMLAAGRDATRWLSVEELLAAGERMAAIQDANYIRATMALPDMEMFDADFFGFTPREAAILDPQHRHFIECCWEALEDSAHLPEGFDGSIGVFGGCGMQAYMAYNLLTNPDLVDRVGMFLLRHTGNDKDFLTTRVSYLFNLHGPSVGVQTACSTSLVAIHVACQSLLARECDMALAGGVSIDLPHGRGYRYAEGEILSSTGRCRAFDDDADGTLFGSGAGVVALRRLEDALADGDNIHAVILGSAVNNDGARKAGYLAPSVDGQAVAAAEALAIAGAEPSSIDYIEAHGTGTLVGDPIELAALQQAYKGAGVGSIGVGSLKTNIGHLDTAAGVASLMKVALGLRREVLPATLNFSKPNSRFDFASSQFKVVNEAKPWPRRATPRRASVNSLGVGGTNAHVIMEEAPARAASRAAAGPQLITLSAKTAGTLEGLAAKWRGFLASPAPDFTLADAAYTTQVGRKAFGRRVAIVARDADELAAKLAQPAELKRLAANAAEEPPRVIFMFPGGGAQYPNAGRKLYENNAAFRDAVDACFAAMPASAPADLHAHMFASTDNEASRRVLEQPMHSLLAVFTIEYGLAKLWESWGVTPAAVIGHSAGEYVAAVVAGVMSLKDAIGVIALRGEIFEAAPSGGMLSVKESEAKVRALMGDELDLAVINAPNLTVVSGAEAPLKAFSERLEKAAIEHAPIRIRVAAHSRMLDDGLPRFRSFLQTIKINDPKIGFISNLSGEFARPGEITADYWVRHLRNTVRFADGMRAALAQPNTILLEVGPGQSLGALADLAEGAHDAVAVLASTPTPTEKLDDEVFAYGAFGRLWAHGADVDFARVRPEGDYRRISLPTYAFERKRHWIEPGQGHAAAAQAEAPLVLRRSDVKDWFEERVWAPAPLEGAAANMETHVVFSDGSVLSHEIVAQLRARGTRCIEVVQGERFASRGDEAFVVNPASFADFGSLIDTLAERQIKAGALLYLWPLRDGDDVSFDAAFNLAKAMQLHGLDDGVRLLAVTEQALPAGAEPPRHPLQAAVVGPVRVLAAESPGVRTRVLDLDNVGAASASRVLAELDAWGDHAVVAWRGEERLVETLKADVAAAAARFALREKGVYLITGGMGGIGLQLARYLAAAKQARLVLIGRGRVPARETWARLAEGWGDPGDVARARAWLELEALGAEVLPIAADVTDADAMAAAFAEARARFGALNGVFHAAGVIDDAPIASKDLADAHGVLAPKVQGARILNALAPDGALDVFAVFSSTSVLLEGPGQSDYVAANRVLDSIAGARADGLSIAWGMWADVGMAKRVVDASAQGAGDPRAHPLLGARTDESDGVIRFSTSYGADALWVLGEHKIGALSVLPGTAYVEIGSAAALRCGLGDFIELRQLTFMSPLVLRAGGSRQARVTLTPIADEGYRIEVESRGSGAEEWLLHFEAKIYALASEAHPLPDVKGAAPVDASRLSMADRGIGFGPRWRHVRAAARGSDGATGEFALPDAFAGDLHMFRAHPALLDTAAATGLFLLDTSGDNGVYAPVSMESVRLFRALPATFSAQAHLAAPLEDGAAVFDVDMKDASGVPVAEIRGAAYRRVVFNAEQAALAAPLRADASTAERLLAVGIRADEANAVLQRLFATGARGLVVSSVDVSVARAATGAPALAKPRAASAEKVPEGSWSDDVERRVAEMCADILGVDDLGPESEFLSYGGGSLAGVRLFARIRREMGVELSLSALLHEPTIRGLATLVRANMPEKAAAPAETPSAAAPPPSAPQPAPASNVTQLPRRTKWTPLVPMGKGPPGARPVFFIHGAPGDTIWFKPLADKLRDIAPVYAIEAQGIDGSLPFLETIEEMANLYVRHLFSIDPIGPYRIVGYSGGGVIALEMAQIIQRSGRHVELLGMLDTLAPAAVRPMGFVEKLSYATRMDPKYLLAWPLKTLQPLRRAVEMEWRRRTTGESQTRAEIMAGLCQASYMRAQGKYQAKPYDGDALIFRASQAEALFLRAGPILGWDGVLNGKVDVVTIKADHRSLFNPRSLEIIVADMRRRLIALDEARPPLRGAQ